MYSVMAIMIVLIILSVLYESHLNVSDLSLIPLLIFTLTYVVLVGGSLIITVMNIKNKLEYGNGMVSISGLSLLASFWWGFLLFRCIKELLV